MGDLVELTTWPSHRNVFYKISSSGLVFEVKSANSSAAVGLAKRPGSSCDIWVVIGHEQRTWIKKEQGTGKSIRTPNIWNGQEYKRFWLLWRNGCIQLGQDYDRTPILSLANNTDLYYVTFSTGRFGMNAFMHERNAVHWRFELPPTLEKPNIKPVTGGELQWVHADNQLPDGALIGGHEKETLYIIRAPHRGSITPGKFVPSQGLGYISWGGEAHEKNEFEVLCGFDCTWLPTFEARIPVNAVEGGYSEDGREKLYVGRASVNGHLIPGKVQPSHRVCYVPYDGREVAFKKYEILVSADINARCANRIFIEHIDIDSPPESETEDDDPQDEPYEPYILEHMEDDNGYEGNHRRRRIVHEFAL